MIHSLRRFKLLGGRTLKTGISVFLTALICGFFNLPIIFAVITAIVTVEHTAADSLKKALVRFPASAIGALLATSFYGILGKGALTFALAAMVTIAVCHKLKLDAGILVATITATAMIPEFHEHYIVSFFTRLGTTSIGIVVSTLVNFFLLPPNYSPMIYKNINDLYNHAGVLLQRIISDTIAESKEKNRGIQRSYRQLTAHLERTYQLSQFQREEWKYHRHTKEEMRAFQFAQKKLGALQQIVYHLGNLQYVRVDHTDFNEQEKELLKLLTDYYVQVLQDPTHAICEGQFQRVEKLDELFWKWKEEHVEKQSKFRHQLPPQTILMYELLCFHDVLEELHSMSKSQHRMVEECYKPSAER
ncbi:aromatic acid exporter family protein [Halobacillus salinarum]|uniref:Aromatic acid exporter family protein n=1 Tax=Halobacillus salinarum TaxID=2932257 RepID=A0ABY4EHS7_9BACI|nr:aromatic acid exporter family protein [Halobacillus salinarum]UOQ43184.1 aromatic acid exporter family protein [Halobacillus salinarum]